MRLPQLNYHHLKLFLEVARSGSLRIAATRLHLSQPTISAQIKSLEKELGEELFDRTGRGMRLTTQGRLVMECASEIFSLGTEMVRNLNGVSATRSMRLSIGVTDSLPKLVAWRLIRPAFKAFPNLHLSCIEGNAQELLGQLASGRIDVVLSDEAAPNSLPVKAFNHLLGEFPIVFCAVPPLAKKLAQDFPGSLKGAPVLLPTSRTAWRIEMDRWFDSHRIRPRVVAEFDDAALMKTAAADGLGVAPIAAAILDEAVDRYGLLPLGKPVKCGFMCYLISLERSMRHPVVSVIADVAKDVVKARPRAQRR